MFKLVDLLCCAPLSLLLMAWTSVAAQELPAGAQDPSVQYAMEIALGEKLGRQIFVQDIAGAGATDELSRRNVLRKDHRIRGWINEGEGATQQVPFVGEVQGAQKILYTVDVTNGQVEPSSYQAFNDGIDLTETQAVLFQARQTALSAERQGCAKNYNTVVIPQEFVSMTQSGFYVFVLAATNKADVVQAGGHQRVEVDETGTIIRSVKRFTNSCIVLKTQKNAVALVLTHLLAPYPEEVHAYLSLLHGIDLMILTTENGQVWKVSNGKIAWNRKLSEN